MRGALILTLAVAGLAACDADEGSDTPFVLATVDGLPWRSAASEGEVAYSVDHPGMGHVFTIASRRVGDGSQSIVLNLPYPVAAGTYHLGSDSALAVYVTCPSNTTANPCHAWLAIPGDTGSLTITSVDSTSESIEGTFFFTGHFEGTAEGSTVSVLHGRFAVHFSALGAPSP